jgi:hypothetical protein
MKLVVTALLSSMWAILNVIIVLVLVWLMFAILGVSLFGGKFYRCSHDVHNTKSSCEADGHTWKNSDSNFDNVAEAMITLFIISSLEGWPDIMYNAVDGTEYELAPEKDKNPFAAYYFIVFILIGSFFFLNLFIAVVYYNFKKSNGEEFAFNGLMTLK